MWFGDGKICTVADAHVLEVPNNRSQKYLDMDVAVRDESVLYVYLIENIQSTFYAVDVCVHAYDTCCIKHMEE